VIRPPRVPKRRSRVATALVLLAVMIVGSAVTAVLYVPTSLEDFAWGTAIVAVLEGTAWAISSLWERLTRKRRRASLSG
jgi:hypothetical protein